MISACSSSSCLLLPAFYNPDRSALEPKKLLSAAIEKAQAGNSIESAALGRVALEQLVKKLLRFIVGKNRRKNARFVWCILELYKRGVIELSIKRILLKAYKKLSAFIHGKQGYLDMLVGCLERCAYLAMVFDFRTIAMEGGAV